MIISELLDSVMVPVEENALYTSGKRKVKV
jgi:hypothetical protein